MGDGVLVKKLLIKQRVVIINPPPGYVEHLGPVPEGVALADEPKGSFDFVQVFVKNTEELARLAPVVLSATKRDAILWMIYPKQRSKVKTDITRDVGWGPLQEAGLWRWCRLTRSGRRCASGRRNW